MHTVREHRLALRLHDPRGVEIGVLLVDESNLDVILGWESLERDLGTAESAQAHDHIGDPCSQGADRSHQHTCIVGVGNDGGRCAFVRESLGMTTPYSRGPDWVAATREFLFVSDGAPATDVRAEGRPTGRGGRKLNLRTRRAAKPGRGVPWLVLLAHTGGMPLLKPGQVIQSEITQQRYRVRRALGAGGFGETYAAVRLDEERDEEGDEVCLKITTDASSWHGEAYFGGFLHRESHVVHMIDAFPILSGSGRSQRMRFCIEMELVHGGTVDDACEDGRLPWPEDRVLRQIRLLLRPLATLHRLGTSHRDITPRNVFLGARSTLKLGDFGLAKTALAVSGVHADAYAPPFRPPTLGTWWSPADDVYQVGLLAMTLAVGAPCTNALTKWDVTRFVSKGPLRDLIKGAIGVKAQRYPDATSMIAASQG